MYVSYQSNASYKCFHLFSEAPFSDLNGFHGISQSSSSVSVGNGERQDFPSVSMQRVEMALTKEHMSCIQGKMFIFVKATFSIVQMWKKGRITSVIE